MAVRWKADCDDSSRGVRFVPSDCLGTAANVPIPFTAKVSSWTMRAGCSTTGLVLRSAERLLSVEIRWASSRLNLYLYPRNPLVWIDPGPRHSLYPGQLRSGVRSRIHCLRAEGASGKDEGDEQAALGTARQEGLHEVPERQAEGILQNKCEGQIPSDYHVDHIRELQIGGRIYVAAT